MTNSTISLAFIFALTSFCCWAFGDLFGVISSRKIGAFETTFYSILGGILIGFLLCAWHLHELAGYTLPLLALNLLLGAIFVASTLSFNQSVRLINPILAGSIVSSFSCVTLLFAIVVFGERLSQAQSICMALLFSGLILAARRASNDSKANYRLGLFFAAASALSWGAYFAFIRILIDQVGWFWPQFFSLLCLPLLLIITPKAERRFQPFRPSSHLSAVVSALLLRSGDLALSIAISQGMTSVVTPIAGSYSTLFALLAFVVFKEPLSKRQWLGVTVTLTSICALRYVSKM